MSLSSCCTARILAPLLAAGLMGSVDPVLAAPPTLRVLIFSGQNNHDWKTTTPKLKSILVASGRFTVETTDHPEETSTATLASYDLILCNWNAWGDAKVKEWPPAAREAFLAFVRGGKGYVSIHAGSSSFYDWPDYQQIGGLFWDLPSTSHGAPHEFTVQAAGDHPILHGLTPFLTKDELWLKPGMHPAAQVIATADEQPLAVTTALGAGRGFSLLLGHSVEFMDTPGFQSILLRGTEWAGSGQVTLRGADDVSALDPADVIGRVARYRFGDDRSGVLALERLVQAAAAKDSVKRRLAASLADALATNATVEGKRSFMDGLSLLGSASEVPAVSRALADTNLFDHARQALERIPGTEAESALRAALAGARGASRAALIQSLAARGAEDALPDIVTGLADQDPLVAGTAIDALGRLGGARAAAALEAAAPSGAPALQERFAAALLRCTESMQSAGQAEQAAALLARLIQPGQAPATRMAAFPRHVAALREGGSQVVLEALGGSDGTLQAAAIRALRHSRDAGLIRAAALNLEKWPAALQEPIITLCGERGDAALLPAITQSAASTDAAVRRAALRALGPLGDASTVGTLARRSEAAPDDERKLIVESLARLRGPEVDAAMRRALAAGSPAQQRILIRALSQRQTRAAIPDLIALISNPDAGLRREAILALGRLADAPGCAAMVPLLNRVGQTDQELLEAALLESCQRDAAVIPALVGALPGAAPSAQAILVSVLGAAGGEPSVALVRSQVKSPHAEVRLAAVRVLAERPDVASLDELADLVESTSDPRVRALAARGLSQLASQAPTRAARAARALAAALAATTEATAQKALLAALMEFPSVSSLQEARARLKDPALHAEAAAGLLRVAEVIYPWHVADVTAALADFRSAVPSGPLAGHADALAAKLTRPANLALGGFATSPDGLEKDGAAGGDQAAIDGNPQTYWDEVDNQKLYRLRVQLREHSKVARLHIIAWAHHEFSPKDFEVLCDDRVVRTVTNAQYQGSELTVEFPPVECDAVELKITGCYGPSPAIRELEIYDGPVPK